MNVTIAIPTYNRAEALATTVRSVMRIVVPPGITCELLVVNNASTDRTHSVIVEAAVGSPFPIREVVENKPGLCFARNRALADAVGEHVVFFDDDVNVAPEWLEGYQSAIDCGATCVVGPVTPLLPQPLPPWATKYVLSLIGSDYSRRGPRPMLVPPQLASEVPGCNFGVRRQSALDVGAFDPNFGRVGRQLLAGEDSEFGVRLAEAGMPIAYEPRCAIQHIIDPDKLTPAHLRRRAVGIGRAQAQIRAKHRGPRGPGAVLQQLKLVAGCWRRWWWRLLTGQRRTALEWELRTKRHLAELTHRAAL